MNIIKFPVKIPKNKIVYVRRVSAEQLKKLNAHGFMVVLR